jgi:hypothetical protein
MIPPTGNLNAIVAKGSHLPAKGIKGKIRPLSRKYGNRPRHSHPPKQYPAVQPYNPVYSQYRKRESRGKHNPHGIPVTAVAASFTLTPGKRCVMIENIQFGIKNILFFVD